MSLLKTLLRKVRRRTAVETAPANRTKTGYGVQIQYTAPNGAPGGLLYTGGCFCYDSQDPFAVWLVFEDVQDNLIRLTFSRELLMQGLREEVGDGDIRIYTEARSGFEVVCITSRSDYGTELIVTNKRAVEKFLEKTFSLVPFGEEVVDLDQVVDKLLSPI